MPFFTEHYATKTPCVDVFRGEVGHRILWRAQEMPLYPLVFSSYGACPRWLYMSGGRGEEGASPSCSLDTWSHLDGSRTPREERERRPRARSTHGVAWMDLGLRQSSTGLLC